MAMPPILIFLPTQIQLTVLLLASRASQEAGSQMLESQGPYHTLFVHQDP